MNTATDNMHDNLDDLTDDARSLLASTAEAAEEKAIEAKKRLSAALDAAKDTCAAAQKKVVAGAKAADQIIHDKPYQAIGVAFGVGVVLGFILSRSNK